MVFGRQLPDREQMETTGARRHTPSITDHLMHIRKGICTWLCMLSIVATVMGWNCWEPIDLPGFTFLADSERSEARAYLHNSDPDFVTLARGAHAGVTARPLTTWPRCR